MKRLLLILTTLTGCALLTLTGCSKTDSGGTTIDTAQVQAAFAAASAVDRAEVDKAIAALKSGDYAAAVASLKQAAANVKLTPEQQAALKNLLAQAQAKLSAASSGMVDKAKTAAADANKAAGDAANKAATDLQKSIRK